VPAALKIVLDVLRFRLRRLEMTNLAAAALLMVVFGLGAGEMAGRLAFGLGLNVLVYLNNDFHDVDDDLAGGRDNEKTSFLEAHMGAAVIAQIVLLVALAAAAVAWNTELLVPLVAGGGICWLYSARLKRVPGLDVVAMTIWGAAMPMVGVPLDAPAGWLLVAQLGLFSAVYEHIQVLRDREADAQRGNRTLAVAIGEGRTRISLRLAILLAGAFAVTCVSIWAAIPIALALLLPVSTDVSAYWNRMRVALGLALLVECATVYQTGATAGLVLQLPAG
jgi:4-hydroxybenzoate polyprenyltransferase